MSAIEPVEPMTAIEGLVFVMMEWAEWHRKDVGVEGYPEASSGISSGYVSATFDDMCEEADAWRAMVVDTCVDELLPAQRAAIMRKYGISGVFRFPRDNFAEMVVLAHENLMIALPKKGIAIPGMPV